MIKCSNSCMILIWKMTLFSLCLLEVKSALSSAVLLGVFGIEVVVVVVIVVFKKIFLIEVGFEKYMFG